MTAPRKLAHVALKTADLETARDWYATVLDADVVFENEFLCFLTYDDEHHRIALAHDPAFEPNAAGNGLHHVSFTYEDLDGLLGTWSRLKAAGIEPVWCIHHGPTLSMYFADPMGNQVELQLDVLEPQAAREFAASETFAANPIGIEFDPAALHARHAAGESFASLTAYGA